jgi:TonB family protein
VGEAVARVQRTAAALARLDVWAGLADVAQRERYVRPEVSDGMLLLLEGSRHPVVERMMPREAFIPNDVRLDEAGRVILLTGPNMAGKSTLLRQVGLCVLLAQIGSFVPARRAVIGVVDRLFTRVGASDNLVRGQSTFMVEMSETSAILHGATARSLVLLDEIGRGTSTYDGVAIAWAVTEHLHNATGCKTIFATHYHELTQLTESLEHVRNWNVAVREAGEEIVFLHRLEPGGADRSYGIHVGRLAGLPAPVVTRAWQVLALLEAGHHVAGRPVPPLPDITTRGVDASGWLAATAQGGCVMRPLGWVVLAALACGGSASSNTSADVPAEEPPVALNAEPTVQYPPGLYDQAVEGDVELRLFVDSTGRLAPESTRVTESSGYPGLDSAAVRGAARLRYAPGRRRGLPVATSFLQTIEFRHPRPAPGTATVRRPAPDSAAPARDTARPVSRPRRPVDTTAATPGVQPLPAPPPDSTKTKPDSSGAAP